MNKLSLIILFLIIANTLFAQKEGTYKKLDKTLKLIENQYVEKVNSNDIVTEAVKAMVKQLDPHSKYMSAESLKKSREQLNGSFAGVGIHYQILDDTLIILNVVKNGPSAIAGLIKGDKLLEIDDEICTGKKITNTYFSKKLRGNKGSKVKIKILRHANNSIHTFEFNRGNIPINTMQVSYLIDKKTGFIKIKNYSRTTNYEFQLAVMQLQMQGMKNLIVDMRGNPGGLMMASIRLADDFLTDGKLIVYTKGANSPRTEYTSKGGGIMEKGRLLILIDNNSASASEIFAGAIQDWDRGLIMGRRSFGKGLVGRNYTLPDGSAVRLTTGRYYTPSGRCIQKSYELGHKAEYNNDLKERFASGELYSADSIHFADSLKYYTDGKRLVYGGGAIMPDIFIPLDTSFNTVLIKSLNKYGFINYYTGKYFDTHLEELQSKYPSFNAFEDDFEFTDEQFTILMKNAFDKHKIEAKDNDELEISKKYIISYFKSILARDLFEDGSYYKINHKIDGTVIKALEVINSKKEFKKRGIHE